MSAFAIFCLVVAALYTFAVWSALSTDVAELWFFRAQRAESPANYWTTVVLEASVAVVANGFLIYDLLSR
jgi:hypothetical protein